MEMIRNTFLGQNPDENIEDLDFFIEEGDPFICVAEEVTVEVFKT